jgi:hypothetical protein
MESQAIGHTQRIFWPQSFNHRSWFIAKLIDYLDLPKEQKLGVIHPVHGDQSRVGGFHTSSTNLCALFGLPKHQQYHRWSLKFLQYLWELGCADIDPAQQVPFGFWISAPRVRARFQKAVSNTSRTSMGVGSNTSPQRSTVGTAAQAHQRVPFAEFYAGLDKDEMRVFNRIVEGFDGETFTTKKIGEAIGEETDENGNGREWISRLLGRLLVVQLCIPSFERYPEGSGKGTPHPGFDGPLAVCATGFSKHRPYVLSVPKYVIRQAVSQINGDKEIQVIDEQLSALEQRVAALKEQRAKLA